MIPLARCVLPLLLGVALAAPAAGSDSGCDASAPALEHSAPFLGQVLTLSVSGAPPGAAVRLFHSPAAASAVTPFGVLALERTGLTLLASGHADASGAWSFGHAIPLDPSLAEVEGHYQALVEDLAAPAGAVLSEAVHLRYVGTRLYVGCLGHAQFSSGATLEILSALDDTRLATLELSDTAVYPWGVWGIKSSANEDGKPVFTADLALGAMLVSPDELVVFDNFSFDLLARIPVSDAAGTLIAAPDGCSALVLETTPFARVLRVDLPTAQVTASVDLPEPVAPCWAVGASGNAAYVAELAGTSQRTAVRRLDLTTLAPLESIPVGPIQSTGWNDVRYWQGRVLASTSGYGVQTGTFGFFSVVDAAPQLLGVQTTFLGSYVAFLPTPVREEGLLFLPVYWILGPPEGSWLLSARLEDPTQLSLSAWHLLSPYPLSWIDLVLQDTGMWALDACCDHYDDGDGPGGLFYFDFETHTWSRRSLFGESGTLALEVVRDALVDKVYVSNDGFRYSKSAPYVRVLDQATGVETDLPCGWGPFVLHALKVP